LEERFWRIENSDGVVSEVSGRGVIGLYPQLSPLPDNVVSEVYTESDALEARCVL
jgi:uncharacterized protein affecting Mg2+/Co2+ transport